MVSRALPIPGGAVPRATDSRREFLRASRPIESVLEEYNLKGGT
jgi:hypothetical protein